MVDGLVPLVHPVLEKGSPVRDLVLELLVGVLDELLEENHEDDLRGNAVSKQLVDSVTDLEK